MTEIRDRCIAILDRAMAVIATPDRWTQGAVARDRNGESLSFANEVSAVRWCAYGAVLMAIDDETLRITVTEALDGASRDGNYIFTNDRPETTHADVIAIFNRAKELIK